LTAGGSGNGTTQRTARSTTSTAARLGTRVWFRSTLPETPS
jgi:hypothetical protein